VFMLVNNFYQQELDIKRASTSFGGRGCRLELLASAKSQDQRQCYETNHSTVFHPEPPAV
jgi:hypothetical protein